MAPNIATPGCELAYNGKANPAGMSPYPNFCQEVSIHSAPSISSSFFQGLYKPCSLETRRLGISLVAYCELNNVTFGRETDHLSLLKGF